MANPLYQPQMQTNPFSQIVREAREFKKSFNGNPRDEVQRLLNSGRMSQQEFNRLSQIAQQVMQVMGDNI